MEKNGIDTNPKYKRASNYSCGNKKKRKTLQQQLKVRIWILRLSVMISSLLPYDCEQSRYYSSLTISIELIVLKPKLVLQTVLWRMGQLANSSWRGLKIEECFGNVKNVFIRALNFVWFPHKLKLKIHVIAIRFRFHLHSMRVGR